MGEQLYRPIALIAAWIAPILVAWLFGAELVMKTDGVGHLPVIALAGTMALATSKTVLAVDCVPIRRRPSHRWQPTTTRTYFQLSLTVGAGAG
jgi:hypothetical protein